MRAGYLHDAFRVGRLVALVAVVLLGSCNRNPKGGPADANAPVLLPVPEDPTVSFIVWFKTGSQNDPAGKEGLAALTGSMLSEGATTKNSYETILAKLYPLASSYQVRVDKEMTTFSGRTHRDNLERFYELFTDALLHPAFSPEDFERLRSNALNELQNTLRYASDEELGKAAFDAFVYEGTPYAHPILGTVQGLQSLTVEDVESFYTSLYTSSNAVIALGGGYPSDLPGRLQRDLKGLPTGSAAAPPASSPPPFEGRRALLVSKPGADASISFGFPIDVSRGSREFYALWVANSWLGEHRNSSSHLYQVIRTARGLNYGDYSYIEAYPEGGQRQKPPTNVARHQQCFSIWIRTLPNDQALFAVRAAMRELDDLVRDGMTQEEFELTRSFLSKYILHFAETTSQRLGYAVDDRFYGLSQPHLEMFQSALRDLTLEEVNAAIRKNLQVENMKIAIVTGDAETLRQQMGNDTPTPIEYRTPKPEVQAEDQAIASWPLAISPEAIRVVPVDQIFEN